MRLLTFIIIQAFFLCCSNSRKKTVFATEYSNPLNRIGTHITYDTIIATIDHKWIGCFGSGACNLIIVKSNEKTIAVLNSNQRNYFAILDSNKIQAYNHFIYELKTNKFDFGCTTTEYYSVSIGKEKLEISDGGCDWDGFAKLRNSLFGKRQMTY